MSQADNLLNMLSDEEITAYAVDPSKEEHIVVGPDRFITVPASLRKIGVQHDHNAETVTFDCPRYWDGVDMKDMSIYVNYMRPDGKVNCYEVKDAAEDTNDTSMMHFTWTFDSFATEVNGNLSFLICIVQLDESNVETFHWNTELNRELTVSEGLEAKAILVEKNADVIADLLSRMTVFVETAESAVERAAVTAAAAENLLSDFEDDKTEIKNEIQETILQDTLSLSWSFCRTELENKYVPQIKEELIEELGTGGVDVEALEQSIKDELKPELKTEIKEELSEELGNGGVDISNLKEEIKEELKPEIKDELGDEFKEEIKEELATGENKLVTWDDLINALHHDPIKVTSFSVIPSVAEKGSTVTGVAVKWAIAGTPVTYSLQRENTTLLTEEVSAIPSAFTDPDSYTDATIWSLNVSDSFGYAAFGSAALAFVYPTFTYYSAENIDDTISVSVMTSRLSNDKSYTVTPSSSDGNIYFYFGAPTIYNVTFKYGDAGTTPTWNGGFDTVKTLSYTSPDNSVVSYTLYRTTNRVPSGSFTFNISWK